MTLLPKTHRTKYCFIDCGKEICDCKPTKFLNDMIQANELRINNWVYNSTTKENMLVYPMMIAQLSRLEKDGGHSVNVHPISLTEEILIKCGFERQGYNDYRHPVLIGTLTLYEGVAELHISDLYSVWVNNLHQLQNLFYCLCGEELEVKI